MSATEVFKVLKNIPGLYEAHFYDEDGYKDKGYNIETAPQQATLKGMMRFYTEHKPDGRLFGIAWGSEAVNFLFNSANMNAEEFVQQFADSYHISEFTHRQTPEGNWQWVYRSPDNITITIMDNKNLFIELDGSAQDAKKSFN